MPNKSKNDKIFSSTEVGVLVESLRSDFRSVTEVVIPLREDMADVKDRLTKVEVRVKSLEDAVRVAIPSLSTRVSTLEAKVGV